MNPSESIFPMNDQHKANPEEWHYIKHWAVCRPAESAILELLHRIEALEAAQPAHVDLSHVIKPGRECPATRLHSYKVGKAEPIENWGEGHTLVDPPVYAEAQPNHPAKSGSSLVERLKSRMIKTVGSPWEVGAASVLVEVAAWLRKESSVHFDEGAVKLGETGLYWAQRLEQEANQ